MSIGPPGDECLSLLRARLGILGLVAQIACDRSVAENFGGPLKDNEPKERTFLQELLRRHVFGASAAYVVGAWVIIQVVDVLAPAFNAPEWTIRAITTVLILAFPLVVVIAWEFDTTRKGLKRTEEDRDRGLSARPWFRRSLVGLISLASLASILWVWTSGVLTDETFADKDENKFPKIVAIDDFKTFAGEESEWLGEGLANLVRDNLSQSEYLRVISLRRWRALSKGLDSEELFEVSREAGIRYLVQGEIIGNRKGFVLSARLTDTADGEQLDAKTFEVEEASSLLDRATSVAQNARAILKVPVEERVDVFAADFAADNPSAYRAFVSALDYWINYDFSDAERMLRASLELQPDFAMARYYLAWILTVQDRSSEAAEILQVASESEDLSPRYAEYIEALGLLLNRDLAEGVEVYSQLVAQYPNDTEARHVLAEFHLLQNNYEAAIAEYKKLTELEPEVHVGWSGLAGIHVQLGDYKSALPYIEKYAALAPDNPNVFVLRGDAQRASGDLEAAINDYTMALQKGPDLQEAAVSLAKSQYLLGRTNEAIATLDKLIRDPSTIPRYRIEAVFAAGGILNALGRFDQHVEYLHLVENDLQASGLFLAKAYADEAFAKLQIEEPDDDMKNLVAKAIAASPGVPTRYLFARGLFELAGQADEALERTAAEIRSHALPPDDPDRTEDKAADYLLGKQALNQEANEIAVQKLRQAVAAGGFQYRLYELALAEALIAIGNHAEAETVLQAITDSRNLAEPRLDLELDRQIARLRLAQRLMASDRAREAQKLIVDLKARWAGSDEGFWAPIELAELTPN